MEVKIIEKDNVLTAVLNGRLDTAVSPEVSAALQPLVDQADKTLVLDCKELSYISSSGLRIFLTVRKAAAAKGGKVIEGYQQRNSPGIHDDRLPESVRNPGKLSFFEYFCISLHPNV